MHFERRAYTVVYSLSGQTYEVGSWRWCLAACSLSLGHSAAGHVRPNQSSLVCHREFQFCYIWIIYQKPRDVTSVLWLLVRPEFSVVLPWHNQKRHKSLGSLFRTQAQRAPWFQRNQQESNEIPLTVSPPGFTATPEVTSRSACISSGLYSILFLHPCPRNPGSGIFMFFFTTRDYLPEGTCYLWLAQTTENKGVMLWCTPEQPSQNTGKLKQDTQVGGQSKSVISRNQLSHCQIFSYLFCPFFLFQFCCWDNQSVKGKKQGGKWKESWCKHTTGPNYRCTCNFTFWVFDFATLMFL